MGVASCVKAFILAYLCTNPVLKGAFKTALQTAIIQLDAEIALAIVQIGRLNVASALLNIQIKAVETVLNQIKSTMNVLLGPLSSVQGCPTLTKFNSFLQNNAVNKTISGLQKNLYEWNRITNLAKLQSAASAYKENLRNEFQEFLDEINNLCP